MTDRQSVIDALTKPFPREAIKELKGRPYVSGTTVIYRLNEATNYDWEFEITGHELVGGAESQGNKPAQVVYGRMRIPIVSSGWRADLGTQALENMPDDHEAYKGAATDCLKRCARQFGVGLHLWGPDIEAGEIGNRPAPQQARPQQARTVNQIAGGGTIAPGVGMTDRQRGFLISLAKELGMVSDNGHHDAAALDAETMQLVGVKADQLSVGKAKEVIDEFVIRRDAARANGGIPEPHPMVQQAMENSTANWIAAMEGAATMAELSKKANEALAANAMTDPVRATFNKRRDQLQERSLIGAN